MITCNSEGHCDECYYGDYDALLSVILTSVTALNVVARANVHQCCCTKKRKLLKHFKNTFSTFSANCEHISYTL